MLRLKELREQNRLSQQKLSMILNVSQSTISAYEIGERTPDLKTLLIFADYFGVSLDYFVGLSELKQSINQSDLSSDELEHLYAYRRLSAVDKEKIKAYMDGLQSKI